jgi:CelD/BcsL family acetyltransferase involved in cellulose biosynthesis
LVAQLLRERDEWDWLHLGGVREDGALHHALSESFVLERSEPVPDYVLPLPATWEAFRAGLSRNMKEALRKSVNAPKRDGVELTFRVETGAGASIERFLTLHHARAESTERKQHRDVFQSSQARAFLREYAAESAACGELRVFELWSGEMLVAVRVGFLLGPELYLYFSGEHPDFAKYSVLTRLVASTLEWAITHGLSLVNLSPGTDVSKTRWNPETIPLLEVVAPAPTVLGPLARQLYRQVELLKANESLRSSPLLRLVRRRSVIKISLSPRGRGSG